MAAGLPFICSNFPGWRKVAEDSGAGIVVDPEDTKSISRTIKALLNDRKKHKRWAKKEESM